MKTNQPKWQFVANLGDVHPIEYGGYFVYRDTTGVYPEEAEMLFSPETDEGTWHVYRFILDRLEMIPGTTVLVPFGFSSRHDLPHPLENYEEWFSDDIEKVASSMGWKPEQLREMFCSENPVERAHAYRAIGDYFGFVNLDSYPLTFTNREEVEKRYQD